MGRSFLSVKLAAGFGLCVAILVMALTPAARAPAAAPAAEAEERVDAPARAGVNGAEGDASAAATAVRGEVACRWRACPEDFSRVLRSSS